MKTKIKMLAMTTVMALSSISALPVSATSVLDKMDVNGNLCNRITTDQLHFFKNNPNV